MAATQQGRPAWWARLTRPQQIVFGIVVAVIAIALIVGIPVSVSRHNQEVARQQAIELAREKREEWEEATKPLRAVKQNCEDQMGGDDDMSLTNNSRKLTVVIYSSRFHDCVVEESGMSDEANRVLTYTGLMGDDDSTYTEHWDNITAKITADHDAATHKVVMTVK